MPLFVSERSYSMNYPAALAYLNDIVQRNPPAGRRPAASNDPLHRIRHLLGAIGTPQLAYPTLHITGTKGKGSVAAMCSAILQQAGLKVGLFTSPHLQDFRERFQIDGQLISEASVAQTLSEIQLLVEAHLPLTWFEIITALALAAFRAEAVDIAIIEVGIGGRADATNVVAPLLSIITSISYDHMSILGETLTEIATEKAGIIKPHTPVISAPQTDEAWRVIEATAQQQAAPLIRIGQDWQFAPKDSALGYEAWQAAPANAPMRNYHTPLMGQHQIINGTVAIAAMYQLKELGYPITEEEIQAGLTAVNWAGRFEIVKTAPYIILDAAHNKDSAQHLANTLQTRLGRLPTTLVFAAKANKEIDAMLAALLPLTNHLVVTQAVDSLAQDPHIIAELAQKQGFGHRISIMPDSRQALAYAEDVLGKQGILCVTGSLYLVGEARSYFKLAAGVATTHEIASS